MEQAPLTRQPRSWDYFLKKVSKTAGAAIGVTIGAVIMVVGYTLGKAFLYSTPEYAILKLPFEILQAVTGAVVSLLLCFRFRLLEYFHKMSL